MRVAGLVSALLMLYLLSLLGMQIYIASLLPVFGWDVLGDWNLEWGRALRSLVEGGCYSREVNSQWYSSFRHSDLVTKLFISACRDSAPKILTPLVWVAMSIGLAVSGAVYLRQKSSTNAWPSLYGLCVITLPLLENHSLVFGYSELPLALGLLMMSLLGARMVCGSHIRYLILVIMMAVICAGIRNTAWIYVVTIFGALGVAWLCRFRTLRLSLRWVVVAEVCLICALLMMVDAQLINDLRILDGSRVLLVNFRGLDSVLSSFLYRVATNSSFSILLLAFFSAILGGWRLIFDKQDVSELAIFYFISISLVMAVLCVELVIEEVAIYGTPQNDTSAGRMLLVIAPVLVFSIFLLCRELACKVLQGVSRPHVGKG